MATRRACLKILGASAAFAQSASKPSTKLGIPGLFRGRVAVVDNPQSIVSGNFQNDAIQGMLRRGMMELTGAGSWQEAWKLFFEPGDVVGIKVNPVGMPHVISSPPVVNGIIEGLRAAGVKPQDIVVY